MVLGAVREGEQASVSGAPVVEQRDGGLHQVAADALLPPLGKDGQWAEKADRSPTRHEVGPEQPPVLLGREACGRVGVPS